MTEPGEAGWIDVSVTVRHGMPHWPDNPPIVTSNSARCWQVAEFVETICLPVKLHGSDGAPARAILRPIT